MTFGEVASLLGLSIFSTSDPAAGTRFWLRGTGGTSPVVWLVAAGETAEQLLTRMRGDRLYAAYLSGLRGSTTPGEAEDGNTDFDGSVDPEADPVFTPVDIVDGGPFAPVPGEVEDPIIVTDLNEPDGSTVAPEFGGHGGDTTRITPAGDPVPLGLPASAPAAPVIEAGLSNLVLILLVAGFFLSRRGKK